ncbi:hypothetical protein KY363_07930 [Candidatus Woesearchaeota archaeon]|nr:hypothetical protein [Candidatus Woesearchaeota archaeon]
MRVLEGRELEDAIRYCGMAAELARRSNCRKSKNGVMLIAGDLIMGGGYNKPVPDNIACEPCLRENIHDNGLTELCHALHAEHNAFDKAMRTGFDDFSGAVMYHARLKKGVLARDNTPTCTHCSRLCRDKGIAGFVLIDKENYVYYDIEEFDRLSYLYVLNKQIKTF